MAESTTTKLNPDSHLLLDQPLLRMPYELSQKNFRTARRHVERERDQLLSSLKAATSAAATAHTSDTLASLDSMISRLEGLKRKLEALQEEEEAIHKYTRARIQHLQDLFNIQSLADVKYEEWSRVRLDRLLIDYLLRGGYCESAKALAKENNIEDLVDVDAFVECHKIEASLRAGKTGPCLNWCSENRKELKKLNNNLEFELRLQQFIELVRTGEASKLGEARRHAQKYLVQHHDTHFVIRASGLLAFPPGTDAEPHRTLYSMDRWGYLAELFVKTHHELYALPPRPLLHIALSAGLSALKTPACHSAYASSSSNASSVTTSVCPICSTELNELARNVPYAHHTKSYVENDPVMLPNGRIYGRDRLMQINEKIGTPAGKIRDPTDMETLYDESEIKKAFIL